MPADSTRIPVRLGVRGSLIAARLFHLAMMALLVCLLFVLHMGALYTIGLLAAAAMLVHEHRLLKDGDLTKLDTAFFNMNGYISLTFFFFTLADVLVQGRAG